MFDTDYRKLMEKSAPDAALVSDTLAKILQAEQGKKAPRRLRATMILVAVLLLGVIGVSAIALGGLKIVNWKGTDVTEEYTWEMGQFRPQATSSPGEVLAHRLIDQVPAGEYWSIRFDGGTWTRSMPKENISTWEELTNRLVTSGRRFPLPHDIPEGFHFKSAELFFCLTESAISDGFAYLGTEVMEDGVSVYKYQLPENVKNNIEAYALRFENGEDQYLFIRCDFGQLASETFFWLYEDQTAGEPVTVKGMLDGLYLHKNSKNYHQMYLRTMYLPNEKIISWPDGKCDTGSSEMPYMICNTLEFSINSNTLDKDQLIKIAQGLR